MIRVVPVREEHLILLSTYVARLSTGAQEREYYLSCEMDNHLNEVFAALADGEREVARRFFCACFVAFGQTFPLGELHSILSYRMDREVLGIREGERLRQLVVSKKSTGKQIVVLGVSDTCDRGGVIDSALVPVLPYSYRKGW